MIRGFFGGFQIEGLEKQVSTILIILPLILCSRHCCRCLLTSSREMRYVGTVVQTDSHMHDVASEDKVESWRRRHS